MNKFQNVTDGVAELKEFYQGPLQTQFNDDVRLWRGAQKGMYNFTGKYVVRPMKVIRNQGIGAGADGGTMPNIGRQTTEDAKIYAKYNWLRFGITAPMIKASQNDKGAFVRSAAYELEEGYADLKSDVNRQLSWDGSGDLARLNAAASGSTSIVVKGREDTEAALKFIDVGMVIDIYNGSSPVATGVEVTGISSGNANSTTATITLSSAVTVSENDIIVRTKSFGNEIQGLLTQLDGQTTTVFDIDRASYISTQGNYTDLAGAALSINSMQAIQDAAERRGGQGISAIYCDYASRRMYQKLLTADKRYTNTVKGDGGFSDKDKNYLEFNGIPLVADKDAPTRLMFLNEKHIEKYVLCNMEFADETGTMYIAQSDVDALEVRIRFFANLFNSKAAGCGVLKGYVSP